MEVHKYLGRGFTEAVYQEAFERELKRQSIPYEREKKFNVFYKGEKLDKEFRADFVCFDKIIVELKAVSELCDEHYAQVLNYLKASGIKLGLLINFGEMSLTFKRIISNSKLD